MSCRRVRLNVSFKDFTAASHPVITAAAGQEETVGGREGKGGVTFQTKEKISPLPELP